MTNLNVPHVETVSVTRITKEPEPDVRRFNEKAGSLHSTAAAAPPLMARAQELLDEAARRVQNQPVASVGLAMVAGFLIGSLMKR